MLVKECWDDMKKKFQKYKRFCREGGTLSVRDRGGGKENFLL